MDLTTMTYEVRDRVAHVRFTRPEGANAVNPAFSADLRAVMVAIEFDDAVKAVSVTAEGKVFCAGGDLKLFFEAGDQVAFCDQHIHWRAHAQLRMQLLQPRAHRQFQIDPDHATLGLAKDGNRTAAFVTDGSRPAGRHAGRTAIIRDNGGVQPYPLPGRFLAERVPANQPIVPPWWRQRLAGAPLVGMQIKVIAIAVES